MSIATVLSIGSALLNLAKMAKPEDSSLEESKKILDRAAQANRLVSTGSAAKSAQRSIIAPMVVVEQNILHQEYMPDLMTIIQLRDIQNVLTHLAMQGSVDGIRISDMIDQINPNRAGLEALSGIEAYNNGPGSAKKDEDDAKKLQKNVVRIDGKEFSSLTEYTPLSLGKVVSAKTMINGVDMTIPLIFRQKAIPMDLKDMELVFSATKAEDGFRARVTMMKTEEITTPDFLTGADLVKERFRILNNEVSGYYAEAQARASKNRVAALRTGLMSFNTMANAFVMSSDAARQIELEIGLRFQNPSARERIFARMQANTIVVCNERYGTFTFYTHGASLPEVYTRNEIKTKAGKDNTSGSLQDLMKLLNGGA